MLTIRNLDDFIHWNESALYNKEMITASRKFILCSVMVNLHGRDRVLTELERFHQGLGLEALQSLTLGKEESMWHFYNPGIAVRSKYIDVWAYLESVIGARIRFMVTLTNVERGNGYDTMDKYTLVVLLSIDHNYDQIILSKLRSALVGLFGPESQGVYQHLQITIIFNDLRIIYNDGEAQVSNNFLPRIFPAGNFISYAV